MYDLTRDPLEVKNLAHAAHSTPQSEVERARLHERLSEVMDERGTRPDEIRFSEALPKTRSGKIMRRLLRDIASGKETLGDTTTLEDYSVLAKLREDEE